MIVLAFLVIGVIAAVLPAAGLQRTRRRGAAAAPGSDIELEQAILQQLYGTANSTVTRLPSVGSGIDEETAAA
jgi:hypothetical protein